MTEPTDAELDTILTDVVGSDDMHDHWLREIGRPIARAVLAKWGQPAQAAEPVAWLRNTTDPQPHAVTNLKYRSAADAEVGIEYIPVYTAPQPVAREPVESSDRRWLCLLCKSSREGAHGVLDDSITPCPNGIKGGQHGTE